MIQASSTRIDLVLARLGLALVALYAAARVLDPEARWAAETVRGDRIEHATVVYLLLIFAFRALPKTLAWKPVATMLLVGLLIELVQAGPGVPGDFQIGDLVADVVGVALACLPLWRAQPQSCDRPGSIHQKQKSESSSSTTQEAEAAAACARLGFKHQMVAAAARLGAAQTSAL